MKNRFNKKTKISMCIDMFCTLSLSKAAVKCSGRDWRMLRVKNLKNVLHSLCDD